MPKLTQKQERFCLSYIETGNASEAYRVNYNAEKMGEPSLNVAAHELLNNPKITLRLAELQKAHQERHKITIDSLTSRLTAAEQLGLSNNNPSELLNNGNITVTLEQLNNPDIGKAKRTTRLKLGPKSC